MKNLHFAKTFDLGKFQVLVTKGQSEDLEKFEVIQSTELNDCRPSVALGFGKKSECDKCFASYNVENAEKFLAEMQKMLS